MRGLFLSFSHSSPILLSGVLALSTHFLWAQGMLPLEKVPIQFVDTPAPFARVSEAQTRLTYRRLPLAFEQNQGQTDSRMTLLFAHYPSHYRLPANTGAALYPATRTTELRGKEKYVIGTAPCKWCTFAPTYGEVPHETTWPVGNLERYGQRIPWAGSIIQRIGQHAKAHPLVARVLKVLKPRL
jgi:hypothetical protein